MADQGVRAGELTAARTTVQGVPVVDLTATTSGLHARADALRCEAEAVLAEAAVTAGVLREAAAHLEQVAAVLDGGPRG